LGIVNASAQGRVILIFFVGPIRELGAAAVRSHNGPAHRSHYHAYDDRLITVGDATLRRAPNSRLDDSNVSGRACNIGTRRDRQVSCGCEVYPYRNILRAS